MTPTTVRLRDRRVEAPVRVLTVPETVKQVVFVRQALALGVLVHGEYGVLVRSARQRVVEVETGGRVAERADDIRRICADALLAPECEHHLAPEHINMFSTGRKHLRRPVKKTLGLRPAQRAHVGTRPTRNQKYSNTSPWADRICRAEEITTPDRGCLRTVETPIHVGRGDTAVERDRRRNPMPFRDTRHTPGDSRRDAVCRHREDRGDERLRGGEHDCRTRTQVGQREREAVAVEVGFVHGAGEGTCAAHQSCDAQAAGKVREVVAEAAGAARLEVRERGAKLRERDAARAAARRGRETAVQKTGKRERKARNKTGAGPGERPEGRSEAIKTCGRLEMKLGRSAGKLALEPVFSGSVTVVGVDAEGALDERRALVAPERVGAARAARAQRPQPRPLIVAAEQRRGADQPFDIVDEERVVSAGGVEVYGERPGISYHGWSVRDSTHFRAPALYAGHCIRSHLIAHQGHQSNVQRIRKPNDLREDRQAPLQEVLCLILFATVVAPDKARASRRAAGRIVGWVANTIVSVVEREGYRRGAAEGGERLARLQVLPVVEGQEAAREIPEAGAEAEGAKLKQREAEVTRSRAGCEADAKLKPRS
eukprot:gene1876-biopygen1397